MGRGKPSHEANLLARGDSNALHGQQLVYAVTERGVGGVGRVADGGHVLRYKREGENICAASVSAELRYCQCFFSVHAFFWTSVGGGVDNFYDGNKLK